MNKAIINSFIVEVEGKGTLKAIKSLGKTNNNTT